MGKNGAVGPALPSAITASATVHVCPTCAVIVGKSVTLHVRIDHVTTATPIARGTTSTYGLLAGSSTTTVGPTVITGDLGVSPGITETGPYVVTGATNLNNAAAIAAQADLTTLYNSLAAMPCTAVLQGTDLGGLTLGPGVYCFTSSGGLTGVVNLDGQGNPNAQFFFKFGSTLTTAASSGVAFANRYPRCHRACNWIWLTFFPSLSVPRLAMCTGRLGRPPRLEPPTPLLGPWWPSQPSPWELEAPLLAL